MGPLGFMPTIAIKGTYRARLYINLLLFKIGYTKHGELDEVFSLPVNAEVGHVVRIPGPVDIAVGVERDYTAGENDPQYRVYAYAHPDGVQQARIFGWSEAFLKGQKTIPVRWRWSGNEFNGTITVKA